MAFNYCSTPLTDHELIACGRWKKSQSNALAIIDDLTAITDYSDASEWLAAIAAGEVKVIKQVKGELTDPSAIDIANPVGGGRENITDSIAYVYEYMDANATADNDVFYETLNDRTFAFAYYLPKSNEIKVILQQCTCFARPVDPMAAGEIQRYQVSIQWEAPVNEFPLRFVAPAGIFTV
jgi:hypothetical protein